MRWYVWSWLAVLVLGAGYALGAHRETPVQTVERVHQECQAAVAIVYPGYVNETWVRGCVESRVARGGVR